MIVRIDDAIGQIEDGAVVGIGGAVTTRQPAALAASIARSGVRDLHLVGFAGSIAIDLLVGAGAAASVASAYMGLGPFGRAPHFVDAVEKGSLDDRESSEWLLLQGLRAAAMGLPFLPTRAATRSALAELRDLAPVVDPYSGDTLLAVPAFHLDVAILHAWRASADGYVQYPEPPDHLWDVDILLARAAGTVIVGVEDVVDRPTIEAAAHLTQLFPVDVDAIVHVPRGAWPTSCRPSYDHDTDGLVAYARDGVLP